MGAVLVIWFALLAFGCNRSTSSREASTTVDNPAVAAAVITAPLPPEQVCMVNNAYMGKKQIPVEYDGKIYYGCCQMCVKKIQTEREVRFAKDPVTGEEVDKAKAYIAPSASGKEEVLYFKSAATYQQFVSRRS